MIWHLLTSCFLFFWFNVACTGRSCHVLVDSNHAFLLMLRFCKYLVTLYSKLDEPLSLILPLLFGPLLSGTISLQGSNCSPLIDVFAPFILLIYLLYTSYSADC